MLVYSNRLEPEAGKSDDKELKCSYSKSVMAFLPRRLVFLICGLIFLFLRLLFSAGRGLNGAYRAEVCLVGGWAKW